MQAEAARGAMLRRAVRFRVLVGADGKAHQVEVTRSSGDLTFDLTYTEALRRRLFRPGTLDSVAVALWVELSGDD